MKMRKGTNWNLVLVASFLVVASLSTLPINSQTGYSPLKISSNPPGLASFNPNMATGGDGSINVVWLSSNLPVWEIMFSRSSDGGRTFSPPLKIASGPVGMSGLEIQADHQGCVYVAWHDNSLGAYAVYFSRSTDDGLTFSSPLKLSTTACGACPQLAVDEAGNVFVIWMGCQGYAAYFSRSLDGGQTFSTPADLAGATGGGYLPFMALAPEGIVDIVYLGPRVNQVTSVFFIRSADRGNSFSSPVALVSQSGMPVLPQISENGEGIISVAWSWSEFSDLSVQKDIFFCRSNDGGLSFSSPVDLNVHQPPSMWNATDGFALITSGDGRTYLAWSEVNGNGLDLIVAHSSDGIGFPSICVSQPDATAYYPSMAVDSQENIHITWTDSNGSRIYYRLSTDGGQSFSPAFDLSAGLLWTSGLSVLKLDSQAIPRVVFQGEKAIGEQTGVYYGRPVINASPIAEAGTNKTLNVGQQALFDGRGSSDSDGTIASYAWDFGDGTTATGVTASHAYAAKGTHTVTLTVTDDDGATATDTLIADVVNELPVALAGPVLTALVCESASFNGSGSYDPDGTIAGYQWNFGDGTTASGVLAGHVYRYPGVYTVTLTVTDNFDSTASSTTQANIISVSNAFQVLIDLVAGFNLQQGINNSLDTKLQRALEAQTAANANQRQDAQNHMDAFVSEVNAQRGKALTEAQADQLIVWAQRIRTVIVLPGC